MKNTLKYAPYIDQPFKAELLRNRVHMITISLNDWCNMLILDNIAKYNGISGEDFRFTDLSRINARLSEYAQFTGGEM